MNAQEDGDTAGIYYDLARLMRILIDFEPIEAAGLIMEYLNGPGMPS